MLDTYKRHARDLCTAKVGTTQGIPVRGSRAFFLLELVGVYHERDGVIVVDVVLRVGKAFERLFGFFEAVLADEVPG